MFFHGLILSGAPARVNLPRNQTGKGNQDKMEPLGAACQSLLQPRVEDTVKQKLKCAVRLRAEGDFRPGESLVGSGDIGAQRQEPRVRGAGRRERRR